jgi:hypothetical protein
VEIAGSKDMSQVKVGDAILTREGKYGHAAIVEGIDADGNLILNEANYTAGKVTRGRRLNPNDNTVIGFIPPSEAPAVPINRDAIDLEGVNESPYEASTKKGQMTADMKADLELVKRNRVTDTKALLAIKNKFVEAGMGEEFTNALQGMTAVDTTDLRSAIKQSAQYNDKPLPTADRQTMAKAQTVLANLQDISKMVVQADKDGDLGILRGRIASLNPTNTNAQQLQALLQQTVPNLARGIFGEVGVLTKDDIANYIQTLPNLKTTREIADVLTEMAINASSRAIENSLKSAIASKYDISGYGYILDDVDKARSGSFKEIAKSNTLDSLKNVLEADSYQKLVEAYNKGEVTQAELEDYAKTVTK